MPARSLSFAVVICTYDCKRLKDLEIAVKSIRQQSYSGQVTTIISVDGNNELYRTISQKYSRGRVRVVTTGKTKPAGLAEARNVAISHSTEDVISFLDDDAFADRDWIANIADSFRKYDCVAVAGKTLPSWHARRPTWLAPALYWLVGATGTVEGDYEHFVRSGFGSNISYLRHALNRVGMFEPSLGMRGRAILQAEEADLGLRVKDAFGKEAIYNPNVVILHSVNQEKLQLSYLFRRAYYQGNSKAMLFNLHGRDRAILRAEWNYSRLVSCEPFRAVKHMPNGVGILAWMQRLLFSISATFAVSIGFIINISTRTEGRPNLGHRHEDQCRQIPN